jgi:hypothetical protein
MLRSTGEDPYNLLGYGQRDSFGKAFKDIASESLLECSKEDIRGVERTSASCWNGLAQGKLKIRFRHRILFLSIYVQVRYN